MAQIEIKGVPDSNKEENKQGSSEKLLDKVRQLSGEFTAMRSDDIKKIINISNQNLALSKMTKRNMDIYFCFIVFLNLFLSYVILKLLFSLLL